MKFHCGQMWIAYISDYGSAERPRNRKTGVNHRGANLRDAARKSLVYKYTGGRIKIHATQQKTATAFGRRGAPARFEPRAIHVEFIGRSMHEIWKKRFIRKYVGFIYRYGAYEWRGTTSCPPPSFLSPRDPRILYRLPPLVPHRSSAYAGNIYFYYNHLPLSWVNRFLVTVARIDPDVLTALMLPEINKSREFELSLPRLFVIPCGHRRWSIYSCKFYERDGFNIRFP